MNLIRVGMLAVASAHSSLSWLSRYAPYRAQTEVEAEACGEACARELRERFHCDLLPLGRKASLPECNISDSNAHWPKVMGGEHVKVCAGPHGSIECLRNGAPVCVANRLCAPFGVRPAQCAAKPTMPQCAWRVYCKINRRERDLADRVVRGVLTKRHAAAPDYFRILVDETSAPPESYAAVNETYYVARRGDCGGSSPNPAHCVADLSNFFAASRAGLRLGIPAARLVVLGSGFNYGAGGPWGRNGSLDDAALWLVWRAGADRGVYSVSRPELWPTGGADRWWFDDGSGLPARIAFALFAPPPLTALTWGPRNCKAQVRSTVLASLRARVDVFVEDLLRDYDRDEPSASKDFVLFFARAEPPGYDAANNTLARSSRRLHKSNPARRAVRNLRASSFRASSRPVSQTSSSALPRSASPTSTSASSWPTTRRPTPSKSRSGDAPASSSASTAVRSPAPSGSLPDRLSSRSPPGNTPVASLPCSPTLPSVSRNPVELAACRALGVGARYRGVLCRDCTMANGGTVDVDAVIRAMEVLLRETAADVGATDYKRA